MKTKILLAAICSVLISCASTGSEEQAQSPAENVVSFDGPAPEGSESAPAPTETAATPEFPSEAATTETVPPGVEQVTVNEPAPELKPVHPATAWVPPASSPSSSSSMEAPIASAKKSAKKPVVNKAKSAKVLKAEKAKAMKAAALAKKNKKGKGKAIAKKPTKAECKKFAKNSKKHKKELAMCKMDKKKATAKNKKSRKVARG